MTQQVATAEIAALRERVAQLEQQIEGQMVSTPMTASEPTKKDEQSFGEDGARPISMAAAARKYGISPNTVWLWVRKYQIVPILAEVGGAVLIDERDIDYQVNVVGVSSGRRYKKMI